MKSELKNNPRKIHIFPSHPLYAIKVALDLMVLQQELLKKLGRVNNASTTIDEAYAALKLQVEGQESDAVST